VELQHELLVHRFGFAKSDIVMLVDDQATRQGILQVFNEHLIDQAKPGDVVVFHYSGHGSLVKDPNPLKPPACEENCELNGTLVPYDPPLRDANSNPILPHIMGRTMFFLRNAVQTENFTLVLDSCFSGAGTRGNVRVRSASSRLSTGEVPPAPPEEIEYQQEWLSRSNLTLEDFKQRRQNNQVNGVAIGSASRDQEALDIPMDGDRFHAGAFTYLLTRYLWQMSTNESFGIVRTNLIRSTKAVANTERRTQVPVFEASSNQMEQPVYFLPASATAAEAVVTQVNNQEVEFWLGGVSSQNLKSDRTIFTLLDRSGQPVLNETGEPIEIQQERRVKPLYGYGVVTNGSVSAVQPGMLLRERIVGLPANPTLLIGLDTSLGNELEAARTELGKALLSNQNVSRIQVVDQQSDMDYLLVRVTEAYQQDLRANDATELPPLDSVALFLPDRSAVVPDSYGRTGEPVSAAVSRLQSKLKLLLVSQVLRAIASTSSDLQITGEVFSGNTRVPMVSRGSQRSDLQVNTTANNQFRAGQEIQFEVKNQEEQEVYLSCIAIDAKGNLIVLHPGTWDAPEEAARIDAQSTLTVPRQQDELAFRVGGAGFIELLTLVSTEPLSLALKGLQTIARGRGTSRGFIDTRGDENLDMISDLLGDLDNMTRGGNATIIQESTNTNQRLRDTNQLAAFSTLVEIVE
jgi:hypothetical protein